MKIPILYEDAEIVVIDKPAGRIVHPAPGHETGSVTEELVRHYPEMAHVGSSERPGVVHRLDMETSGVMVFARTQASYLNLRRQFEAHTGVHKEYLAILMGVPQPAQGTISTPIGREHLSAVTHWQVLGHHNGLSLVSFKIDTGRMHQIRIHAAELGCPVAGDRRYGNVAFNRRLRLSESRQLLHAVKLSFRHPRTGEAVSFMAPPPPDICYA